MSEIHLEACENCKSMNRATLPDDWQERSQAGDFVPVVECGDPWHYTNMAHQHQFKFDTWPYVHGYCECGARVGRDGVVHAV